MTPRAPLLISAIYNYCDRWCERCRFKSRCLTAVMNERLHAARAQGQELSESDVLDELLPPYDGPPRPWLDEIIDAANRMTEDELREIEKQEDERRRRLEVDTLVLDAKEYGHIADRIVTVLSDQLKDGDPVVLAAVAAISHQALCIGAKVYRACSGEIRDLLADFDLDEDELVQSDHNGSAKVARLMIAESRHCWAVLMQVGRAVADGVPLKMVERLDRLDRDLAIRFPRAMEFVRPGFDEEA